MDCRQHSIPPDPSYMLSTVPRVRISACLQLRGGGTALLTSTGSISRRLMAPAQLQVQPRGAVHRYPVAPLRAPKSPQSLHHGAASALSFVLKTAPLARGVQRDCNLHRVSVILAAFNLHRPDGYRQMDAAPTAVSSTYDITTRRQSVLLRTARTSIDSTGHDDATSGT